MDLGLKDKVILVTGGSSGIGEAIVRTAAKEGARLVIVGRNQEHLEAVSRDLTAQSVQHLVLTEELTSVGVAERVISATIKKFGSLYALINNAAVNDGVSLEKGTLDDFRHSLEKNLVQVFALTQAALPHLKKSQGAITNIGSKVATTGQGGTSGYAASKGGLNSLTREWAVDLLASNVRVNCVIPAECETPAYTTWLATFSNPQEKLQSITDRIPLGKRMTTAEEIATMTLFVTSPLSSHTTGQVLYVDGGYTHLDRAIK
jgi:L-fucose dehydrogenase